MFENKKIFILGMARSGYEAAKVLAKRNNIVIVNDFSTNQNVDKVHELENMGVKVILGSHPDDILTNDFDYLIKIQALETTTNTYYFAIKTISPSSTK